MKRTKLSRHTPLRRKKGLRKVGKKRQSQDREYARLRREFLEANPWCRVCLGNVGFGRTKQPFPHPATEIHHQAGRGRFYLQTDTFLPVCAHHHRLIHDNPKWAKEQGYILTPEQRRKLG